MSKRPAFYLINGGLAQEHGIYRLRERQAATPTPESWPTAGEWRRLILSLIRNPVEKKPPPETFLKAVDIIGGHDVQELAKKGTTGSSSSDPGSVT